MPLHCDWQSVKLNNHLYRGYKMNETIKTLLNRRSIRQFKPDQIKNEDLNTILEAAKFAPSAANQQSTIFIVIQNKEMREKIVKLNASFMKDGGDPYYGAPTLILVLAKKGNFAPVEDASLALGNIFNAAYSLGLGTCWIHRVKQMFESTDGKALLKEWGIEGDYMGVGSCALGYPAGEHPGAAPRKANSVVIVR